MSKIKLSDLLYHFYDTTLYTDIEVTGLAIDSREVIPGDLFFAYKGSQLDGKKYIDEAIQKGAVAILADTKSDTTTVSMRHGIPIFPIEHINQSVGKIAARFYNEPNKKLQVVGVTGTNGKTSITQLIGSALQKLSIPCGIIGTLGNGLYGNISSGKLTTPDAISIQKLFADFIEQDAKMVAMEVSSHSLDQGRVNGIDFKVAIFTNLTRDHLDYHKSMQAYGAAKKKLFENDATQFSVINSDDDFGKHLLESLPNKNKIAYSLNKTITLPDSIQRVYADKIKLTLSGIQAEVVSPWGKGKISVPLVGKFNLSNVLAVFATLCLLDIPFKQALESLHSLAPVSGRMEPFGGKNNPLVIIDYAHTPDALEKALSALREHCEGKLFCLFGCGGDRDRGKRPLMAKIAEHYADYVVVTDDNPRKEDPSHIVEEIMQGFANPEAIMIEHDRSKAIKTIIQYAKPNDCVLIAGKGAEIYQYIGDKKIPFSDIEKVKEILH